jgi:16S rRNA C967 or C1407 C5-methylase (RsmB/RsmF family)
VDLQRQIIADSILLLAPRGRVLYCTCSIDTAENEQQAQWVIKWHRMTIAASASCLPRGLPGELATEYCDGGYWALLSR